MNALRFTAMTGLERRTGLRERVGPTEPQAQ